LNMDSDMAVGWRNLGRDPSDSIVERRSILEGVMPWLKKSDGSCVQVTDEFEINFTTSYQIQMR